MIVSVNHLDMRELATVIEGLPWVWVEVSQSFSGHPERLVSRAFGQLRARARFFSDPGKIPPDPPPVDAAGPAAARGRLWKQKALPQPPTVHLKISGEAGDFHTPSENAKKHGVFHERPQAHYGCEILHSRKTQEPRQKKGTGLTPLNHVSIQTG